MEVTEQELFMALAWVLENRTSGGLDEDGMVSDGGCGCCANTITPPSEVLKVLQFMERARDKKGN